MVPWADSGAGGEDEGFFLRLSLDLCKALRVEARYNTPDSTGETRREINKRFGEQSPPVDPPAAGAHLWNWYKDASRLRRTEQGYPQTLTATEWVSWAQITGNPVRHEEYQVLREMDEAFVGALCREINDQRQRSAEIGRHRKAGD